MPKAVWNGVVIAEADQAEVEMVESNVYFPAQSVRQDCLQPSTALTSCPWKGQASYYHVSANGEVNKDAAWTYRDPLPAAKQIAGRIAFWKDVRIEP
jgi:uncharacterized protein (DUF427 family)